MGVLAALPVAAPALAAQGATPRETASVLAERAAGGDLDAARSLRALGPAGLSALEDVAVAAPGRSQQPGYRAALDVVCAQVGCATSHLYWYTDLAAARAEAARTGRPILALRLLGRLDETLSCANSRWFRLLLYSDPAIAGWLRTHVVLYWSSERPVPRVTIDYGDGRRLVGTVTGNSIHYFLDPDGRLVDALPGLHTPKRFLAWLVSTEAVAREWAPLDDTTYVARLRERHARDARGVTATLTAALVERGWSAEAARLAWSDQGELAPPTSQPPTAAQASRLAYSKSSAERPILDALGTTPIDTPRLRAVNTLMLSPEWSADISPASLAVIEAQAPAAARADLDAARLRLENRLAEDGLRNEAFLHRRLHERIAASPSTSWLDLNDWVYRELFLTPASDPWLGLAPTELLSAVMVDAR
jgi:hypothetical protein